MGKTGWLSIIVAIAAIALLGAPAGAADPVSMATGTPIGSFPEWVNFYGVNSIFNGQPLPVGAEVVAYAGANRCGSFVVHTPGQYGLLPCYRDRPEQPGAQPGDRIRFTINGFEAIVRGPDEPIWTFNGDRKHVELEASGAPQTPTGTPTQTTMPTSTPTGTWMPPSATPTPVTPPTATPTPIIPPTPTATMWVPPSPTPTFWAPPTFTPTWLPPATPTPVVPSPGFCRNPIQDSGFEAGGYWTIDPAPRPATRSTAQTHTGLYAMRLGIVEEPNASSPSAIRQRVEIPLDATVALLSFYYYPVSEADPRGNYWEALLLEPGTGQIIAILWRNNAGNERRWLLMNVDLLPYRGRTFDLYFNLYNSGISGRSALYLDDVAIQLCTPGPATFTPTPTFVVPTATPWVPPTPYPTPAGACQEMIVNGDFEAGTQGWYLGPTQRMPSIVGDPRHGGNQAMRLGFLDGPNVTTFSSIRQTVAIPSDVTVAEITFWVYLMSSESAGQDHQEFVLLSPSDNSTLALPWREWHNNSRVWMQHRFDLSSYRGQSIVVYFNAYNDGAGGSTAMVIDDISLRVCRPVIVTPTAIQLTVPTHTPTPALVVSPQAMATPAPTVVISLARSTPTPVSAAKRSKPLDPRLVAGIAITVAILLTILVVLVVRGPRKPQPPSSTAGPPGAGSAAPGTPPGGTPGPTPPTFSSTGFSQPPVSRPERPPVRFATWSRAPASSTKGLDSRPTLPAKSEESLESDAFPSSSAPEDSFPPAFPAGGEGEDSDEVGEAPWE